ncbi:MAG: MGMT family protein [Bacteroidales bacterium]
MNNSTISYYTRVYNLVRKIPAGKVCSYGCIAEYLGMRGGGRMVGWAMNLSHHQQEYVPAHRVVNKAGLLSGKHHFGHPDLMKQLLENEGIEVINDQIQDFDKHFWNPAEEFINQDE